MHMCNAASQKRPAKGSNFNEDDKSWPLYKFLLCADLSEVLLLPLLLLMSDMGDMQEERPEMLEIPESEWEWLCFGLGDTLPSPHEDSAREQDIKFS